MNETKLDIYPDRNKAFERELKKLQKENISKRNKELITEFQNYIFSTGSKELRVAKLSSQLRNICRWKEKALGITLNLDQLTKKEAMQIVSYINKLSELSEDTRADYRRALKQFFRWFKEEDNRVYSKNEEESIEARKLYNYLEKEVSSTCKLHQADPNTILTEKEIQQVVDVGTTKPKDKAFIALLHETGCRAGEFLNLKIGDIEVKDSYAELHIPDGKTGRRILYVVKSLPYLLKYLDVHAFKDSKNSYLWLSDIQDHKKRNTPLVHIGGQRLIQRCFERAGIKKKHNWHWFRHSRATILAPQLTEVMLCKYMGWVIASKQVKTYVHLCSKQLEDVFLALNGIKTNQEVVEKPTRCICGTLNIQTERYCHKCFKPLSVEVVVQDKELVNSEINKTIQFMMEMTKNPEMMQKFEQFKNNLKI